MGKPGISVGSLERGREAHGRAAWGEAFAHLSAADQESPLYADDLQRLAMAAYLTGRDSTAVEAWGRAHQSLLELGRVGIPGAVRCAFWAGVSLTLRGQHAQAGGWFARGQRLLEDASLDCVERGYLLIPSALQAMATRNPEAAYALFTDVAAIGNRFDDSDVTALGRLGCGQALVAMGRAASGVAMLDEAMVSVTAGEVSSIVAGIVYCAVILACRDIFDLRRAQEWTAALSRWCTSQPDLYPYRGQCLIHRSEILQLRGEWSDALHEVEQAWVHLSDSPADPVMGMARHQQAELLRLRGEFSRAEEAYRDAGDWGHPVQPGLALLRLAQGRNHDAVAAIRRVIEEAEDDRVRRSRVLAAYAEIVLAVGDVRAAREATNELKELAADFDSPYLRALAAHATGAVLLAEGEALAACDALRRALTMWQELDAPYEAARSRVLTAQACRHLGDHDTAEMEIDLARRVFEQLRAAPDLARVAALRERASGHPPGGLTPREVEVLGLVATGATNRQIAHKLIINEKTVARHLSNMFTKLGVSSRAAATAYAYEHDLV